MDTGRELEEALRELEVKLPELRRLMAGAALPFGVVEEAEAWAEHLLQAVRLTDGLASQFRRVILQETAPPVAPSPTPTFAQPLPPSPDVRTEMEQELERVLGSIPEVDDYTREMLEQTIERFRQERPGEGLEDGPIGGAPVGAGIKPPPPGRSPSAGRTFEEAEEPARNP